ncbi:MAG: LysE family transporter [Rhizobiales bacterium]|nr:LysE family transporter [Hyphomicrobiales bacterium]
MQFLIGFIVGIAMTAPVGSANLLCMRQSLRFGFVCGLVTASGALFADALFAAVAIFGVGYVAALIAEHERVIQTVGGFVVIIFAIGILRHHESGEGETGGRATDATGPLTTFVLTITNPGTVFGFLALFSALSRFVPPPSDFTGSLTVWFGVISGCALWWFMVAGIAARFRQVLTQAMMQRINTVTGVILLLFGIAILGRLVVNALL